MCYAWLRALDSGLLSAPGLAPWQRGEGKPTTHGTTKRGTTGAGWGRITHNTGNHRGPSRSLRHTDENDGDDVVHNDVDVLFPVWLLVVPLLLCCSGLAAPHVHCCI